MTDHPPKTDETLIVGAGPVGLMMAAELARHGAACRIIDKSPSASVTSKALGIQTRTLEIFDNLGVADRVIAEGHKVHGINMYAEGKRIVHLSMDELDSRFPFVIVLPQSRTEAVLADHLQSYGIAVQREVELVGLVQTAEHVNAILRKADGTTETVQTPWVIGCDGAHSAVRRLLALPFEGGQYDESFWLADVDADWQMPDDELHIFFHEAGLLVTFPFGGRRIRVVTSFPPDDPNGQLEQPTFDAIQKLMDERGPANSRLSNPTWLSAFKVNHRRVSQYRQGRVFVAGDAAHIHSPAGGQGMNTGLQDAYNLAWKLALVQTGRGRAGILDSYNEERVPIARDVLTLSDRMTVMANLRHPIARHLRDRIAPILMSFEVVQQRLAVRLSELGVNYKRSPIVSQAWGGNIRGFHAAGPEPGERAIDGPVIDSKTGEAQSLFRATGGVTHNLLIFSGPGPTGDDLRNIEEIGRLAEHKYPGGVTSYLLVHGAEQPAGRLWAVRMLLDGDGALHKRYAAGAPCAYIVRPDGYIGFRALPLKAEAVIEYLSRILVGS